jgi:stage II sporulation protein D
VKAPASGRTSALASLKAPSRPPLPPMLRRALLLTTCLALAATSLAGARTGTPSKRSATVPPPSFYISGRGWGHGIGMSQWGAYGYAQRGTPYDQILAHYYRSTTLGKAPVARVRVLLGEGLNALAVASDSAFSVRDGSGTVYQLRPGPYSFGPALKVKVDQTQPAKALPGPLVFLPGATPLKYGGKQYRGQFQVNASKSLQLVNSVGLEPYLYGVVPREVPFLWPAEALKAQAVVARSYALAVRKTGAYDLYADTRSQVYGGIAAEKPTTNAAVDATAGQVLLYEGKVATTFFFSTSGGRTASIEDVWTRGEAVPYLVGVPDPYDTASPHHTWGPFAFTAAKLTSTFKVPGKLLDVRVTLNPSLRVDDLILTSTKGEVVVPGDVVRTKLGLRSTWFRVGVLTLEAPTKALEYGSKVKLKGVARAAGPQVTLEQRTSSAAAWQPVARLKPGAGGVVIATVKPLVSTEYRLSAPAKLFGAPIRVSVAPRVRLSPATAATLRGLVRPVTPGARVDIQRLDGSSWRPAATASVDAGGAFEARLDLTPGMYRARVAPGRGLVAGYSPVLQVVSG